MEEVGRSTALVAAGEGINPDRCQRVWMGATDEEEEVKFKHVNTICPYCPTGSMEGLGDRRCPRSRGTLGPRTGAAAATGNTGFQPNGVRLQNCAGIWNSVRFLAQ